jgi:hypothetical protein
MALDYSKLTDEQLQAIADKDYSKLPDDVLQHLASEHDAAQNQGTDLSPEALAARNSPVTAGATGAIAGTAAATAKKGVDIAQALNNIGKTQPAPTAPPVPEPYVSPGQKWSSKTGFGAGEGETVREVDEEFKRLQAEKTKPAGHGKITSRITGGTPDEIIQRAKDAELEAARLAKIRAEQQIVEEAKRKQAAATALEQKLAHEAEQRYRVPNKIGKMLPVVGATAAYNVADAATQDNLAQQGIAATGALGSAAPFIKKLPPKARALGFGASLVAPLVNKAIDTVQGQADGGLVHLAPGGTVAKKVAKEVKPLWEKFKYDRYKISQDYPEVIPPVLATDAKTGKEFLQKQLGPDALEVQKARKAAQKEIDAGNYQPHFDINQRFYADPSHYPTAGYTQTDIVPKKADTIAKYTELANDPEALARLRGAFEKAKDRPAAKDWYAMGQLEDAFIKELGPEEGRKQFKNRFADAMAATTGGADPNSNLMMAAYTNYRKELGREIPTKAADLPFPIGGRFVSGNMEQAKRLAEAGEIPVTNPKRHNFSANFLGHRDVSTLDEQMSQLWDPKMMSPPPNAYGIYQKALADEAKKAGVQPANFQDIAWAGAKDYPGKPMMQEINEMLGRTSKITGEPQEEVLKGFIRGNKPMYGIGALSVGAGTQDEDMPHMAPGGKIIKAASDFILPAAENASRTQIIGTLPTYAKAAEALAQHGATGRAIDFGAGLGEGAKALGKNTDTYEPFAKNWNPTFTKPEDIPSDAYNRLTNLNVLNVVPREARDEIAQHIGRVMEPGGLGILTTRGADVMKAQGRPGPEPMSMITSRDTYQKGFTKQELEDYMRYMLGDKFDINKFNLGPAGVMIKKK